MTVLLKTLYRTSKRLLLVICFFSVSQVVAAQQTLSNLDFQRSADNQARLFLEFSQAPSLPQTQRTETGLALYFANAQVEEQLRHLYDAADFNTQVMTISLDQEGSGARVQLEIEGNYSYSLHRQQNQLRLDISPQEGQSTQERNPGGSNLSGYQYTGEPMSFSYQDIPVRQLLKEMADFLDLNLIAGEEVTGNITLQLEDVPSDQALDLVLTTHNLASRQVGNVLLVAPADRLVELEQQQFAARQSEEAVEPLVDDFIRVHFASATQLRDFILGEQEAPTAQPPATSLAQTLMGQGLLNSDAESNTNNRRFLSERGHLMVDQRTNQVYVRDTAEHVERVRSIIEALDIPVDQVMIEARIVVARTGVSDELGVTWGASDSSGSPTSSVLAERARLGPDARYEFEGAVSGTEGTTLEFNPQNGIGFGFVNENFLLDLELAALETENRSEIISQPKVITSDRVTATIRSGEQIPYRKVEDGSVTVEFQNAELALEVTPQITNDGRILMELQINNDSKGEETADGYTINSNSVTTQVLADNGQTLVIGGIFTSQTLEAEAKTPILGDIPLLGLLFRRSFQQQEKVELLVFITPRVLNNNLNQPMTTNSDHSVMTENQARPSRGTNTETGPQPVANQATAADSGSGIEYLLEQPEDRFVLQVYADTDEQRVKDFVAAQQQPEELTFFPAYMDGKDWYLAVYGDYANLEAAEAAIEDLPPHLQALNPWPRSYRVIHRLIRAGQE
ncbi:type IV pilus secretin PilQ [Marinospirillum perlucidum]|uniref:type IV pilus secretin PilQ n=1 Tax=Marinospirillum perlucidum TaxID=1982602 RepID=UPI000DF4AD5E|nr:type IV pilus secretin PilQ [Marinospirillum perlucidum]